MAKILIRFERGDVSEILETRPNGLWRGRCGGRVGTFKFIMVEVNLALLSKQIPPKACKETKNLFAIVCLTGC